jgi:hypothetical protein
MSTQKSRQIYARVKQFKTFLMKDERLTQRPDVVLLQHGREEVNGKDEAKAQKYADSYT